MPLLSELAAVSAKSFEHPDARRRFRLISNLEELERALDYPWEKWTVFLHPAQRELVEREYNGPARVSGSAGTGKTIVAILPDSGERYLSGALFEGLFGDVEKMQAVG